MKNAPALAGGALTRTAGQASDVSIPRPTDTTAQAAPFQVMPPLSDEEYAALRAEIAERGILVPVLIDQHGRTIDGHHRQAIAAELGIDCPTEVRHVDDDDDAHDHALVLNLARRHLTREQKRELVVRELERKPDDSDRAIGRRLGCDHKTVGSVRRLLSGEIPHDDEPVVPMSRAEAEAASQRISNTLAKVDLEIVKALLQGFPPARAARLMLDGIPRMEREAPDREIADILRDMTMQRVTAILGWPDSGEYVEQVASVDDELRALLEAQRQGAVASRMQAGGA